MIYVQYRQDIMHLGVMDMETEEGRRNALSGWLMAAVLPQPIVNAGTLYS